MFTQNGAIIKRTTSGKPFELATGTIFSFSNNFISRMKNAEKNAT